MSVHPFDSLFYGFFVPLNSSSAVTGVFLYLRIFDVSTDIAISFLLNLLEIFWVAGLFWDLIKEDN